MALMTEEIMKAFWEKMEGKETWITKALTGYMPDIWLIDEMGFGEASSVTKTPAFDMTEVARFEHKAYPLATVTVHEQVLNRHDPRNPNPAALGSAKEFVVRCGERRISSPFKALTPAKAKAQAMHEQMIAELEKKRADRQLEELERLGANERFGIF